MCIRLPMVIVGMIALAGCGSSAKSSEVGQAAATPPTCSDTMPGTGLCRADAGSYLRLAAGPRPEAPKGCTWVVNEMPMPGDKYLLYFAAKCNGKMTTLDFAGGAHKSELSYAVSTMGTAKGEKVVEIWGAEPGDPKKAVLIHAREMIKNPKEAAQCQTRAAGFEGWPADALVVDIGAAEAAKLPKDGPRSACGPYGLDEDSQTFWRVFQGFSWFFNLGQDSLEIDPGSFTIVRKDDRGKWIVSE